MWGCWFGLLGLLLGGGSEASRQGIDPIPRSLGEVQLSNAAFIELYPTGAAQGFSLFVSTFNPVALFQTDPVFLLENPGDVLGDVPAWGESIVEIDSENYWPNNPDFLPGEVLGREGIVWTSGFLVPTKTKGRLNLYFTDVEPLDGPYNIASLDEMDWSYHRVIWKDVDGDGDLDAVTARFHVDLFGSTTTEFLWLENEGELTGWTQHSISDGGADVHFRNAQLGSYDVFIVGEFFAESLTVYYVAGNDWASPDANVQRIVIDTPGQIFDVYVDDFNRDGRYEVLATVYDGDEGHVYIYDIPADFLNDPWERRSIADEFFANFILLGQSMTPGSPKPFYPSEEYEEQTTPDGRQVKPWISLSGDDDGKHYILVPVSEDADDWTYEKNILVDTGATTSGKIAIADLDGDGYTELIAAGYSIGKLYVFTYAP